MRKQRSLTGASGGRPPPAIFRRTGRRSRGLGTRPRSSRVVSTLIVVVLTRRAVRAQMVKLISRATVSGSRAGSCRPFSRRRRASMESDSRSSTSSDPSVSVWMVLNGTDFAPFLTRQARWAPRAGEPDPPVHGEEPAVGQVKDPGGERGLQLVGQGVLPVMVAADRGGDPPPGPGARRARRSAAPPLIDDRDHKWVVGRAELADLERHGATASIDTGGRHSRSVIIAGSGVSTAAGFRPARRRTKATGPPSRHPAGHRCGDVARAMSSRSAFANAGPGKRYPPIGMRLAIPELPRQVAHNSLSGARGSAALTAGPIAVRCPS